MVDARVHALRHARAVRSALLAVSAMALAGCGWSGPLYHSGSEQETSAPLSYAQLPVVTTDPPVAGAPMTVDFTVSNNTYPVFFNVPYVIYLDDNASAVLASGMISEIDGNGVASESVQVTAPAIGSHTITVVIDPQDVLQLGEASGPSATIAVVTVAAPPA